MQRQEESLLNSVILAWLEYVELNGGIMQNKAGEAGRILKGL